MKLVNSLIAVAMLASPVLAKDAPKTDAKSDTSKDTKAAPAKDAKAPAKDTKAPAKSTDKDAKDAKPSK
jgi:hypothetical protein